MAAGLAATLSRFGWHHARRWLTFRLAMSHEPTRFLALASLLLGLSGCGDDATTDPDSGITFDALPPSDSGRDAGPVPSSCDAPRIVEGEIGTVTVSGDTTEGAPGALDLGLSCGNPAATTVAPQDIIAYRVPGSGPVGLNFSLAVEGTPVTFDTLVQIRTSCAEIPTEDLALTCFDDTDRIEARSSGAAAATGGETLFFVVTGLSESTLEGATDRGPYTMTIEARANAVPEITTAEVRRIGPRVEIEISGSDGDGDVSYFGLELLDASDAPVDLNGDGAVTDRDRFIRFFDEDVRGMTSFTAAASFDRFGDTFDRLAVVRARLWLIDEVWATSEAAVVDVTVLDEVGLDAACDATHVCALPLQCSSGSCTAPSTLAAACATATPLPIDTPTTDTTTATVTGTLAATGGGVDSRCSYTPGTEAIYTVEVPAGSHDLLARTDLPESSMTDTVLYVRSRCEDPLSELACNDDIDTRGRNYQSQVEILDVTPGSYAVVVDPFRGLRSPSGFGLEVALRPVLASGAACDPTGAANRCAGATACPAATSTCP